MENRKKQSFWSDELKRSAKHEDMWKKEAKKLYDKYISASKSQNDVSLPAYNIFYSNVETIRGALKIDEPKPSIRARYDVDDEKQGKLYEKVASILEKASNYYIDESNIGDVYDDVNKDSLVTGRGVPWVVYDADVSEDEEGNPVEVKSQSFKLEYVNFEDFRCSIVRTDEETTWVGRKHLLSKEEVKNQFGSKIADKASYTYSFIEDGNKGSVNQNEGDNKAEVWEIWDKPTKCRIFYSKGVGKLISVEKDPYKIKGFFPCEPLRYIKGTQSNIPSPEYNSYAKKAEELQVICKRRSSIVRSAKANGLVNARIGNQMMNLSEQDDGVYMSVEGLMRDAGGMDAMVWERNLAQTQSILAELTAYEQTIIRQIYDITGISDIMRGSSDPRASATAEGLKGKFGSLRLVRRQQELQKNIKCMFVKTSELIAEHATQETLAEITGVQLLNNFEKEQKMMKLEFKFQSLNNVEGKEEEKNKTLSEIKNVFITPTWEEVIEFLRNNKLRSYSLDIESNITAFDDEVQMNASIDNLFASFTSMVSQASQMIQQEPALLAPYREMILAKIRISKAGRSLEDAIMTSFDKIEKNIEEANSKPDEMSPEMMAARQKSQEEMQKQQLDMQKTQMNNQAKVQTEAIKEQGQMSRHRDNMAQETRRLDLIERKDTATIALDKQELDAEANLQAAELAMGGNPSGNLGI